MLSAGLALESHNLNFVYPTIEPSTAQYHVHDLATTSVAAAETKCESSPVVVPKNGQKKTQRNLQQHQLHAQFLHEQYLAQQTVSLASPASSSSSPSSPLLSSPSSTTFDLFGKSTFIPPSTAVLENWRNDLLFVASASDSFSHSRKTTSSASNATCTITSGSFQSMKQSSFDSNLTSKSTTPEIDNNHKFLVPKVPNKISVSSNRCAKKEQHHYLQQNHKKDPSSKTTPSKNNDNENIAKPSTTKPLDNHFIDQTEKSNLRLSENKNALKIPSGKEGSLKHRILTSFSPEKEETLDEPEDLSLKNVKSVLASNPERTKACSISSLPLPLSSLTSPSCSTTASSAAVRQAPCESKKRKRSRKIEFKKAHNFLKGLSIKMDNGTIRKIEEMTTDDLLQSIDLRPDLMISNLAITSMSADLLDSTNNKINVIGQFKGSNKKKEISIKRSDPFFVYGSGWASYDPELTKTLYGADCKRLTTGDVIVMLKNKTKSLSLSSIPNKKARIRQPVTIAKSSSTKPVVMTAEPNNNHSQNVQTHKHKKENESRDHKAMAIETGAVALTTTELFDDECTTPTKKKKHFSASTRNSYPCYPQNFHHPSQVPFDLQIQAQLLQQQQQQQHQQQQQQQQQHQDPQQHQYHSPLFPHSNAHFPQPFAYSPYAYHPYPLSYQQFYFPQTSITHHTHISNAIGHETESNLK